MIRMNSPFAKSPSSTFFKSILLGWGEKWGGKGVIILFLALLLALPGCEEEKPLTPEQESFVSAWSIRESLQKAFQKESVDDVMALLGPPLSTQPDLRAQLEQLFAMFKTMDLSVVMDSGTIDTPTRSITFQAHWTLSAIPHDKRIPHYFKTGECRMVVTLRKAPHPSRLKDLIGDTFLAAPAKPGPAA